MGEPLVPYTVQGGKNFDEIFRKQKQGRISRLEEIEDTRSFCTPSDNGLDADDAAHDETRG